MKTQPDTAKSVLRKVANTLRITEQSYAHHQIREIIFSEAVFDEVIITDKKNQLAVLKGKLRSIFCFIVEIVNLILF